MRSPGRRRSTAGTTRPTGSATWCRASFSTDVGIDCRPSTAPVQPWKPRAVAAKWPNLAYAAKYLGDALRRLAGEVDACRTIHSHRADLDLETGEDIGVFSATVNGMRVGAAELLDLLRAEAERSRGDGIGQTI
jgi:hypothetical protein